MRAAEIRTCLCGDRWATLDLEAPGNDWPTCRAKIKLFRYVGGRLPGAPEEPKSAAPPSLEEQA